MTVQRARDRGRLRRLAAAVTARSGPSADAVTAWVPPRRAGCDVCGRAVRSGQTTCESQACAAQVPLFVRTPDRRQKGWRDA